MNPKDTEPTEGTPDKATQGQQADRPDTTRDLEGVRKTEADEPERQGVDIDEALIEEDATIDPDKDLAGNSNPTTPRSPSS